MALVSMKKMSLLSLRADKPRLMRAMQRLGCVQIIEGATRDGVPNAEEDAARLGDIGGQIERLDLCIRRLSPFDGHKPRLLDARRAVDEEQVLSVMASRRDVMETVDRVERIERLRGEFRTREARIRAQIERLAPWEGLAIPLERLGRTRSCELTLLDVPSRSLPALEQGGKALGAVELELVSEARGVAHVLLAAHIDVCDALEPIIRDAGAHRVMLGDGRGTAALRLDQLHSQLRRIAEVREQLSEEIVELAGHLPVIRVLRDVTALSRDRLAAQTMTEDTRSAFYLTGWVPEGRTVELDKALKRVAPLCEVEFTDPAEEEKPPTLMRNNGFVSPFEAIVRMFSMPDPGGIDPTLVMMPFWVCFFGMMMGDAGYGIILGLVAGFLFHKLGRRSALGRMAFIGMVGGVSTVFWGAMYGGWFSIEGIPALLFSPMDEPLLMVGLCLAVGAVHIFSGIGMAAYMKIKRGDVAGAFYDHVSWMLLLVGLGLLLVSPVLGWVLAGAGVLAVLLMAGRAHKNPVRRVLSGLGALYGISGYVSDLLSYMRLFGMGLATGIIGMVFNMLAGMLMHGVGWVFAVLLLLVGHTFNLSINALGAYVHSCRLQFIEFFGKFYESGGRDFMPLTHNTRYVDILDGDESGDIAA